MELLGVMAGLWFVAFALVPIQIYHDLGPVWTVVLIVTIILCVRVFLARRRARMPIENHKSHRRH